MTLSEKRFTVISWASGQYKQFFDNLQSDCQRFGYPCHLYEVEEDYQSLVRAWCNHPQIIRKGIQDFGTVLFLDVECRIVAPIPDSWSPPLVSVRSPRQKFWIRYNTGTVMADQDSVPWLDAWIRIIDSWQMKELEPQDFVHWPGDICDELALAGALATLNINVKTPTLEYIDRKSRAEIARGLWRNSSTIVQHPTLHHWPAVEDIVESKKLFVQNFPGDPNCADQLILPSQGRSTSDGWVFDGQAGTYAPEEYWLDHQRSWTHQPVQLTAAQR